MKVGITLKENAYTPEAHAYKEYLEKHNIHVQLDVESALLNNDLNIYFMGLQPFWNNKKNTSTAIVHEYHSLSIPPYAKLKDFTKKLVNQRPDARIFLNHTVSSQLNFPNNVPFICREMGVDSSLFQSANPNPSFDIVYHGSFANRSGLIQTIIDLAKKNFTILLIGKIPIQDSITLNQYSNITQLGMVTRDKLPALLHQAKAGLNYTPDIYPFNIQTSTKTLEYIASNLLVISNHYMWSSLFSTQFNYPFIWLNQLASPKDLDQENKVFDFIKDFKWDTILENANFLPLLQNIVNKK